MARKNLIRLLAVPMVAFCTLGAAAQDRVVDAAKRGDSARALALLKSRADVNLPEADGTTALHWAAHREDLALIDALIAAGAKISIPNRYGVEPISVAAENANAAVIDRLLKAGANANAQQPGGVTPLLLASRAGKVEAVKLLLAAGAQVNYTEPRRNQTALMWAAAENHAHVIKALLNAGADTKVRTKPTGMLSDQEPGERAFTAYLFAAQWGASKAVDALLEAGVDIEETLPDGAGALHIAVANSHWDLAVHLLERGANPNADTPGFTALHYVIWNRRVNTGSITMYPVPRGEIDSLTLIRKLVSHGADVNARITREPEDRWIGRAPLDKIGGTPFFLAAHKFDIPLMQTLLELGADPKVATSDGSTALMASTGVGIYRLGENPGTFEEITESTRLCLKIGCGDVNAANANGETALHGAAMSGAPGSVQLLVDAGAKLDPVESHGWTPLRLASGVEVNGGFSSQPEAAALLREILLAKGYTIKTEEESAFASLSANGATGKEKPGAAGSAAPKPEATPK